MVHNIKLLDFMQKEIDRLNEDLSGFLRIKNFFGTSENAVKSQIWIAVSVYVLVAIMKKQFNLQESLYTILQILSVSVFEKIPIYQLVTDRDYKIEDAAVCNQLKLFDY